MVAPTKNNQVFGGTPMIRFATEQDLSAMLDIYAPYV